MVILQFSKIICSFNLIIIIIFLFFHVKQLHVNIIIIIFIPIKTIILLLKNNVESYIYLNIYVLYIIKCNYSHNLL